MNCLSLLFQVWALVKNKKIKKKNLSLSSFQPFVQQPVSILSMPLLGGGLHTGKMWVLPNTWLVKAVMKSGLPKSVVLALSAGLDILASSIFGLD